MIYIGALLGRYFLSLKNSGRGEINIYQRITIILVLLIFVALGYGNVEGVDWKYITRSREGSLCYIDRASIQLVGESKRVRTRQTATDDMRSEMVMKRGLRFSQMKMFERLIEVNCPERKIKDLKIIFIDFDYKTIDYIKYVPQWRDITPGSINERIYKAVCKKKPPTFNFLEDDFSNSR